MTEMAKEKRRLVSSSKKVKVFSVSGGGSRVIELKEDVKLYNRRMMLLGAPCSGKTTFCKDVAMQENIWTANNGDVPRNSESCVVDGDDVVSSVYALAETNKSIKHLAWYQCPEKESVEAAVDAALTNYLRVTDGQLILHASLGLKNVNIFGVVIIDGDKFKRNQAERYLTDGRKTPSNQEVYYTYAINNNIPIFNSYAEAYAVWCLRMPSTLVELPFEHSIISDEMSVMNYTIERGNLDIVSDIFDFAVTLGELVPPFYSEFSCLNVSVPMFPATRFKSDLIFSNSIAQFTHVIPWNDLILNLRLGKHRQMFPPQEERPECGHLLRAADLSPIDFLVACDFVLRDVVGNVGYVIAPSNCDSMLFSSILSADPTKMCKAFNVKPSGTTTCLGPSGISHHSISQYRNACIYLCQSFLSKAACGPMYRLVKVLYYKLNRLESEIVRA